MNGVSDMDNKEKSGEEAVDSLSTGISQIGLNVMAPAFVPSFLVPNNVNSSETTPEEDKDPINNTESKQSNNEDVVDDWEANADEDDEEDDEGDDGSECRSTLGTDCSVCLKSQPLKR